MFDNDEELINPSTPFRCHLCPCGFADRPSTFAHIQSEHAAEYTLLKTKGLLDTPVQNGDPTASLEAKLSCLFCPSKLKSFGQLRKHVDESHKTQNGIEVVVEDDDDDDICLIAETKSNGTSSKDVLKSLKAARPPTKTNNNTATGQSPAKKIKRASLMDKINQLSTAAASAGGTQKENDVLSLFSENGESSNGNDEPPQALGRRSTAKIAAAST